MPFKLLGESLIFAHCSLMFAYELGSRTLKKSRTTWHFVNQSKADNKPLVTWLQRFF